MSEIGNFSTKQAKGVSALLTAKSVKDAAELAGVGYRTMLRWLDDPGFRAAPTQAEAGLLDHAARRLTTLQEQAIDTLADVLADERQSSQALRIRAAGVVLDYTLKLRELRTLEERIRALEAKVL